MTPHPADEWFARTYKGAPTDSREVIRAAYLAGAKAERERALAIVARLSSCWLDSTVRSAVGIIREEVARE